MSIGTSNRAGSAAFNIPNQLTTLRLVLSVLLFVLVAYKLYMVGLVIFIIAASTDWLDGYLARRWGLVTTLGRILDPFVDKVIVCGTFILLIGAPEEAGLKEWLRPWMVVVIVGRELLITALRSFLEQQGADFSATMSGKLKMVLQCIAAGVSLFYLGQVLEYHGKPQAWLEGLLAASIWSAVALTIYSGVAYIRAAILLLRT